MTDATSGFGDDATVPPTDPRNADRSDSSATLPTIGVILASTRPGRAGEAVARWVHDQAGRRADARFELVDLAQHTLPDVDEPVPPAAGHYTNAHTVAWAETVRRFDGFVIVTPEYNHSFPGKLKNALDRVFAEWNNKAVSFVSYGSAGGVRAVDALRVVCGPLQLADVGPQVALSHHDDWDGFRGPFTPRDFQARSLTESLDALIRWSTALTQVRADLRGDPRTV